jgi:hypothetical protein
MSPTKAKRIYDNHRCRSGKYALIAVKEKHTIDNFLWIGRKYRIEKDDDNPNNCFFPWQPKNILWGVEKKENS